MANLANLPSWARRILEEGRVGHLGLLDDADRPRVLPVAYVLLDGVIWTAVDSKPKRVEPGELARVRYLRRRPEAALTVDRYSDDWSRLAWVQVLGSVEVLDAAGLDEPLAALAGKYEPYRAEPPPGPLLRLAPERAICWRAGEEQGTQGRAKRS